MYTVGKDFAVFRCVDGDGDAFVENIEFAFPIVVGKLLTIDVYSTVELIDVFESFVFQKSCGCFAANASSAIGDHFFVFVLHELFFNYFRELFEVLHG